MKAQLWAQGSISILILGIYVLVGLGTIDWRFAVVGVAFLLFALAGLQRARGQSRTRASDPKKDDDDDHPPGASALPRINTPLLLLLLFFLPSCTLGQRQVARDALSVLQVACAIAHAEADDQTVAQVCGVADALIPDLRTILSEQRKAIAKAKRVGGCQ